jgi:putative aldouronate transport system substrate-binding protein
MSTPRDTDRQPAASTPAILRPAGPTLATPSRPAPRVSRRTALAGGAAALAGAATLPRITFAQEATPAGTPVLDNGFARSTVDGVPDVCIQLPQPYAATSGVPGRGGTVRGFVISYAVPGPGRDENQYWQELERRLGVTWEIDQAPQPVYGERSSALFAGGDLPDLFYLNPNQGAPQQYQALAQGAFLDLTDYLTGDALQQFPNLARFPEFAWRNSRFQGRNYGIPLPGGIASDLPFYRSDWATTLGITPARDLTPDVVSQLLTGFATGDPDRDGSPDTWGAGRFNNGWTTWDNGYAVFGHGVPFNWRLNADGTMTAMVETDEYRQALQFLVDAYAAGAYHPDAATMTYSDALDTFVAGGTGFHSESFGSFFGSEGVGARIQQVDPAGTLEYFVPHRPDGTPGVTWNTPGFFGQVAIPSTVTDEERVLELLRIMDWLAAPFGSEEWLFKTYGIEGVHFTRDERGNPITTERGTLERAALTFFGGTPSVIFTPEDPQVGLVVQQGLYESVAAGIDDPSLTLYSAAEIEQGPSLDQFATDRMTAIVTGRESIDTFDDVVQEWLGRGGQQIREEFQQAIQEQGGL